MKILYDGIGSNPSGEHTEEEFLKIMSKEFTHKNWSTTLKRIERREEHDQFVFKDWILPDDFVFFTLNDWIEYSGAEIGN
jgi:hypothetical protein